MCIPPSASRRFLKTAVTHEITERNIIAVLAAQMEWNGNLLGLGRSTTAAFSTAQLWLMCTASYVKNVRKICPINQPMRNQLRKVIKLIILG